MEKKFGIVDVRCDGERGGRSLSRSIIIGGGCDWCTELIQRGRVNSRVSIETRAVPLSYSEN